MQIVNILGSEKVPDEALQRACYVLRFLLADIRLLREKYFRSYGRVAIMAVDEVRYLKLIKNKVAFKV